MKALRITPVLRACVCMRARDTCQMRLPSGGFRNGLAGSRSASLRGPFLRRPSLAPIAAWPGRAPSSQP